MILPVQSNDDDYIVILPQFSLIGKNWDYFVTMWITADDIPRISVVLVYIFFLFVVMNCNERQIKTKLMDKKRKIEFF